MVVSLCLWVMTRQQGFMDLGSRQLQNRYCLMYKYYCSYFFVKFVKHFIVTCQWGRRWLIASAVQMYQYKLYYCSQCYIIVAYSRYCVELIQDFLSMISILWPDNFVFLFTLLMCHSISFLSLSTVATKCFWFQTPFKNCLEYRTSECISISLCCYSEVCNDWIFHLLSAFVTCFKKISYCTKNFIYSIFILMQYSPDYWWLNYR